MTPSVKAGEKLRKLLDEHGVTQTELGDACHPPISPTSVGRYIRALDSDTLNEYQWERLAAAIQKVGLDAAEIRPLPRPRLTDVDKLFRMLDTFNDNQLEALINILNSSDENERMLLRVIAQDRLRRR